MIYNIFGQPKSGKSTLAKLLKKALETRHSNKKVFILESSILQKIINNPDTSEQGRRDNINQTYNIAKYLNTTEDFDVIIATISPYKDQRDELRLFSDAIEIYVHTEEIREVKTNQLLSFEPPFLDYIDINTTNSNENESAYELFDKIQEFIKAKR